MDSGVETGNDSNDSTLPDKFSKMDLGNSGQDKPLDSHKDGIREESLEILNQAHCSQTEQDCVGVKCIGEIKNIREKVIKNESLYSHSFQELMRLYEVNTSLNMTKDNISLKCSLPKPILAQSQTPFSSRDTKVIPLSLDFNRHPVDDVNSLRITEDMWNEATTTVAKPVLVSGGPLGTEYQSSDLITKISRFHRFSEAMRRRIRCLRYAEHRNSSMSSYFASRDKFKLCRAINHNDTDAVRALLEIGMSPNFFDSFKRTPLHLAACMGYADIVELLLDYGADPNAKDGIGNTPLHLAACTNHVRVTALLLRAGTRVNERDTAGHSPLQLALTKLNIMRRSVTPNPVITNQIKQVVTMMTEYMRQKEHIDPELISKVYRMLKAKETPENVESNIQTLLSKLSLSNTS